MRFRRTVFQMSICIPNWPTYLHGIIQIRWCSTASSTAVAPPPPSRRTIFKSDKHTNGIYGYLWTYQLIWNKKYEIAREWTSRCIAYSSLWDKHVYNVIKSATHTSLSAVFNQLLPSFFNQLLPSFFNQLLPSYSNMLSLINSFLPPLINSFLPSLINSFLPIQTCCL